MTVGELQRVLTDVHEDMEVVMDFNGNGRERVRSAVVADDSLVITNMEDYET